MKKICPNDLRKFRVNKKLKQEDVARILKLKDATNVSRWENGVRIPDPMNLFKLAVLYDTTVDFLFAGLKKTARDVNQNLTKESIEDTVSSVFQISSSQINQLKTPK